MAHMPPLQPHAMRLNYGGNGAEWKGLDTNEKGNNRFAARTR